MSAFGNEFVYLETKQRFVFPFTRAESEQKNDEKEGKELIARLS